MAGPRRNAVPGRKVTILGGGNTAFSVAARLAHMGNFICPLEHPDFTESISEIMVTNMEVAVQVWIPS